MDAPGVIPWYTRAMLALFVGVLAVSGAAILIKLSTLPKLTLAAWRLGLAALVLLAWKRKLARDRWAAVAGVFLGLHFATWISSLSYTSVASSVVLVTTNPLFVGLGSALLLRERVSPRLWLGVLLSILGGVIIALGDRSGVGSNPLLGDALALAGAVAGSAYLLVGRYVRERLEFWEYVTTVYTFAALTLVTLSLLLRVPLGGPFSPREWALIVALAVVPQLIGHTLINFALRRVSAAMVAASILGEPVGACILAMLVLHEGLGWKQAAGAAFVLAGVYLSSQSSRK